MPEILCFQKKIERMDVFLYLTGKHPFVCLINSSEEDVWEYSLMAGMNFSGVHRAGSGFKIILNL